MSDIVVPERPLWCFEGDDPDEQDDNEAAGKGKGKKGTWKRKGIQNEVCHPQSQQVVLCDEKQTYVISLLIY